MNEKLILNYFLDNYKKIYNKNIVKQGFTNEDLFQDKILALLELNINIDINYIKNYSKNTSKRNVKIVSYLTDNEDNVLDIEESYNDKIKLLFINYRPYEQKKDTIK